MEKYELGLEANPANFEALTPLSFLPRSAMVYPDHVAMRHGDWSYTYSEFYDRAKRLASALEKRGIAKGDTVSVMAPNIPALLEAHFGVPVTGAVLNALNTRLDAETIAFILDHGECKLLFTDREHSEVISKALKIANVDPVVIDIDDPLAGGGDLIGEMDYETFLKTGDPEYAWGGPDDEWQAIALN